MRQWRCCWVIAMILASGSSVVHAQRRVAVETDTETRKVQAATELLQRLVSVKLQHVRLSQALDTLGALARTQIGYRKSIVAPYQAPVSVNVKGVPLGEVLKEVLGGTPLYVVLSEGGLVVQGSGSAEQSASQGVITGKVLNARTQQPLAGVVVTLDDATAGVTADQAGAFRITASVGEHTVWVKAVGMRRQSRKVTVAEGETVTLAFALEPNASVLDEIVVTGTVIATERKAIPTPITVIKGEELEQRGITRIDQLFRGEVPGLFALEQGVQSYSTQSVGLGVSTAMYSRGSAGLDGGPNPIKTYIDGVELLDPSYLGTIDPRSIERIEIVTGPQAATIYGSGAMGGVMQIFTKKGSENTEYRANLKYGMLQNSFSKGLTPEHHDGLSLTGGIGSGLSYAVNVSYDYSGQWQPDLYSRRYGASLGGTSTRGRLTVTGSVSATASTQGTWRWGYADYGQLQLMTGPEGVDLGGLNVASIYASGRVQTSSNQTISLNADYRATPAWQHHVTLGRSQNILMLKPLAPSFSLSFGGQVGTDTMFQVNRSTGQRTTWNYNTSYVATQPWLSSSLTIGVNGSVGDQLAVNGCQASAVSSSIAGCSAGAAPIVSLPLDSKSWGGFGSWQIGLWNRLYTTVGLRAEQNPNYGNNVKFDLTPTNGLTYTIEYKDISLKLLGSYGRATRTPPADRRLERLRIVASYLPSTYVNFFANPDLRPEYSRGPQGGFELYYGNRGSLSINHYQQTVTDLIQSVPVDSILVTLVANGSERWEKQWQWQNVAKVRQEGWEGTGSLQLGPLSVRGTYSWTDSRVLSVNPTSSSTYQVGQAFQRLPTHTGNVMLSYAHGPTSVMLSTNFVGAMILPNSQDSLYNQVRFARLPMYTMIFPYSRLHYDREHAGYAKSDFSGSHRVSSNLTVTVNVVNVGNGFESEVSEMTPSLGRQTMLGVSYRFRGR